MRPCAGRTSGRRRVQLGRAGARLRELTETGGDAAGRGGEHGLGVLPAQGPAARPRPRPHPAGPAETGLVGPSCLSPRPNQRAPPTRPAPSPSGDRKSAQ